MGRQSMAAEPLLGRRSQSSLKFKVMSAKLRENDASKPRGRLNPLRFTGWIRFLLDEFGTRFVVIVFCVEHVLKGFTGSWLRDGIKYWFRAHGGVSAPQMQVYMAVTSTPWCLKGLLGFVADSVTFGGYKRTPHMLVTVLGALAAYGAMSARDPADVPVRAAIGCFFAMQLCVSTCDLLVEARYSEAIQQNPAHGQDVVSFVWGGVQAAAMVGVCSFGAFLQQVSVRWVFAVLAVPLAAVLPPILCNFMEEDVPADRPRRCLRVNTNKMSANTGLAVVAVLVAAASVLLLLLGVLHANPFHNFAAALLCGVLVVASFAAWTPARVAKINAYFLIAAMCSFHISGASFYFFTDTPAQYPAGPHFSELFYVTAMGLAHTVFTLAGIAVYNTQMRDWTWRAVFFAPPLVGAFANFFQIAVYLRWNTAVGVPDKLFVLGSEGFQHAVYALMYVPGALIISHVCPRGLEATMFALLAGARNLGNLIGSFGGAALLRYLGVQPRGALNETDQFKSLWVAAAVAGVAHALPLVLIPWLIPSGVPSTLVGTRAEPINRQETADGNKSDSAEAHVGSQSDPPHHSAEV